MLEKNKDYVEFTLQYTSVDLARSKDCPEVCLKGYSDFSFPGVPMDVVCNEFDHKVVVVSKSDFERLQTEKEQLKKKLEEFSQVDLEYYRALSSSQAKSVYNWKEATGCSTPEEAKELIDGKKKRIIELNDELDNSLSANEELKKKLAVPDPFAEYKELFEKLRSKEDVEKFEWTLNHICGGQASANGWMVTAKLWRRNYEILSKLVGFSSVEEIQDYLTNDAECDTLQEAISKLKDQVKYTCDEWYSANSRNNSWKAAAECNSPKELIEKREALEKEIGVYSRALQEWKEGTGCPSPSAAKTMIESQASWCHAYHEAQKENRKLTEEVDSWKNVTGYSIPEDYLHARISGAFHTPFDYTAAWQKATKCDTPEQAKERIKALNKSIDESEADYNHLLMLTGFESEGEIEDALDKCDHSTLRKALVDYEFDYEALLKLTGYKNEHDIRVLLNDSEQFVYENMRELINSLKRKAKFTESNWQHATGCDTPGRAEEKLEFYKERLGKAVQAASCAAKHLENVTD